MSDSAFIVRERGVSIPLRSAHTLNSYDEDQESTYLAAFLGASMAFPMLTPYPALLSIPTSFSPSPKAKTFDGEMSNFRQK